MHGVRMKKIISYMSKNQSHYRPEVPRGFKEVTVPGLRENVAG